MRVCETKMCRRKKGGGGGSISLSLDLCAKKYPPDFCAFAECMDNLPRAEHATHLLTHRLFFPILQLYREDDSTGEIVLSLSSDSTCTSGLRSSSDGAETLSLRPRIPRPWPAEVLRPPTESPDPCRLPRWAQGKWQHLHVSGGSLILRDQRDFKTYTARCVGRAEESGMMSNSIRSRRHHRRHGHHRHHNSEEEEEEQEGRFLIYARTHCGDESYQCLWIKNRGNNALEFQIGKPHTLTISHIFFEEEKFEYSSSSKIRTHLAFPSPPSGNENYSIRHFPFLFFLRPHIAIFHLRPYVLPHPSSSSSSPPSPYAKPKIYVRTPQLPSPPR